MKTTSHFLGVVRNGVSHPFPKWVNQVLPIMILGFEDEVCQFWNWFSLEPDALNLITFFDCEGNLESLLQTK